MKRSIARRTKRWVIQELTRLLDPHKPKESFGSAAAEVKLEPAASHGAVRWTALIARPRRRRDRNKPP